MVTLCSVMSVRTVIGSVIRTVGGMCPVMCVNTGTTSATLTGQITSVVAVKGGKGMLFFVHPKSHRDYTNALEILQSYKVKYQDNVRLNKHYITVSAEDGCPETTLCEMAFQMNFRQAGKVCATCKGKGKNICGHLTFTSYIY